MCSNRHTLALFLAACIALLVFSCGPSNKLKSIQEGQSRINILGNEAPSAAQSAPQYNVMRDTLKVKGENGEDFYIMKAERDSVTGEMVATEVLNASIVVARFRHVAERHGKLDLYFQIQVPEAIRDSRWQIRITPRMVVKNDTTDLHEVMITGADYNKERMRKYEVYDNLLKSILDDYDLIDRKREIEIFIERHLPELHAMRLDSAYVSEEVYTTMYDVSHKEIIDHYGLQISKVRKFFNDRRKKRAAKMEQDLYSNYPTLENSDKIRLDTLVTDSDLGLWSYDYLQTLDAEKGVKSINMLLSGSIYEGGKKIADIATTDAYTFYISTLSGFYRHIERYVKKVVERRAAANTSFDIKFSKGKSDINPELGLNAEELLRIRQTLAALMQNETFDLDSVIVTSGASPEGGFALNARLADDRSRSVTQFVSSYTRSFQDSLAREAGFSVDEEGNIITEELTFVEIPIISRSVGEDWETLDRLVETDTLLTEKQIKDYGRIRKMKDPDARELRLKKEKFYQHVADSLYPILRRVEFDFFLHRKGMIKDTIQTTEPDTLYRNGLRALEDMDYDTAVKLLEPYKDFNTAIALMGVDRNYAAKEILLTEPETADVDYLFAILWSRMGDEQKAVQYYLKACREDPSFVHRGNLDPEISALIKTYNLNADNGDDFL